MHCHASRNKSSQAAMLSAESLLKVCCLQLAHSRLLVSINVVNASAVVTVQPASIGDHKRVNRKTGESKK